MSQQSDLHLSDLQVAIAGSSDEDDRLDESRASSPSSSESEELDEGSDDGDAARHCGRGSDWSERGVTALVGAFENMKTPGALSTLTLLDSHSPFALRR